MAVAAAPCEEWDGLAGEDRGPSLSESSAGDVAGSVVPPVLLQNRPFGSLTWPEALRKACAIPGQDS